MTIFEIGMLIVIGVLMLIVWFRRIPEVTLTDEQIDQSVHRVADMVIARRVASKVHRDFVDECVRRVCASYDVAKIVKSDIPTEVANKLFKAHRESLLAEINSEEQLDKIVYRIKRKQV